MGYPESSAIMNSDNNQGLGVFDPFKFRYNRSNSNNGDYMNSSASAEDFNTNNNNNGVTAPSFDYQSAMTKNIGLQNQMMENKLNASANLPKFGDINSFGSAFDWATADRGNGSNYASMGLGALNAGMNFWQAKQQNKYQGKMADISSRATDIQAKAQAAQERQASAQQAILERQQSMYEGQVAKQEAKQAAAQKAYDDAQNLRM